MTRDRTEALQALLAEAGTAHAVYERDELNGVYDQGWPRWYAHYAVDHGIGSILGRDLNVDELADFLTASWAEQEQADPKAPWATYTARRIAKEL